MTWDVRPRAGEDNNTHNMLSSNDTSLAIAARLKSRRLARRLTQQGLADRSGVSLGTLKKFER